MTAYPLGYAEEAQRQRGPPAAATQRLIMGWADLRRRAVSFDMAQDAALSGVEGAALLVVGVALLRLRRPPRALRGLQLGSARSCDHSVRCSKVREPRP